MEIPDLFTYPDNHPPSPYPGTVVVWESIPDRPLLLELPTGLHLIAIGWLGKAAPSTGAVSPQCVDRLFRAYEAGLYFCDGTSGWHDCEICTTDRQRYANGRIGPVVRWQGRELRLYGHGHHLVRHGHNVYMCPLLLLHYILDHAYRPPEEFVRAVVDGRFLIPDDLVPIEGWSYDKTPGVCGFVPTGAPPRWHYAARIMRPGCCCARRKGRT